MMNGLYDEMMSAIVGSIIILFISLIITIVLYVVFLPDSKRASLSKTLQGLHDFLKMKKLYIEKVIRFIYVLCTISGILSGFYSMKDSFIIGLLSVILSPIVTRLIYECLMLKIIEVRNVVEINSKLKAVSDETVFDNNLGDDFAEKTSTVVSAAISAAKEKANELKDSNEVVNSGNVVTKCPECGATIDGGSFCPNCGTKIN